MTNAFLFTYFVGSLVWGLAVAYSPSAARWIATLLTARAAAVDAARRVFREVRNAAAAEA